MKLNEYLDIDILHKHIDEKYISDRKHSTLPLHILNYTPAAQGSKFDDVLSKCRGLVYEEDTLDLYAIPFKKFWNYNDEAHPETLPENLPSGIPTIYEKMDGSLGIGFFYRDEFIVVTRGSFQSDQAKFANIWVENHIAKDFILSYPIVKKYTYLFEIIAPFDKKVVDYSFDGLILLGTIKNETLEEYGPYISFNLTGFIRELGLPRKYEYKDLKLLEKIDHPTEEGYVATWYNTTRMAFRVKIKFETYKRLHRLYFQTSTDVIWEMLKSGKTLKDIDESLVGADNGLRIWVGLTAGNILKLRNYLDISAKEEFRRIIGFTNYSDCSSDSERRKTFALQATSYKHPQLMFLMYDGKLKEYEDALWKLVKMSPCEHFRKVEE